MKLLLLILFLFRVHDTVIAQVQLTNLNFYSLNGNIFLLKESDSAVSIKSAVENFDERSFKLLSIPDNNLNLGFTDQVYWLAIPLKNILNKSINLEAGITNQGVYHVEYYFISYPEEKIISKNITGKSHDFYSRIVDNRHYYFPFTLGSKQQGVIFYRIDLRGNDFFTPLCIVTKEYRLQTEARDYLSYAFFSGFLTFVSFFSFVTFLWTRDRVYLFYCLYVASCCLLFLADGDVDFQWLYPHWPAWATIAPSIYGGAIVFFMLFFMNDFLELKTTHKKLFISSRLVAALIIIALILIPIGYIAFSNMPFRKMIYYYGFAAFVSGWLLQVLCIAVRIFDRYRPAYLYGLAIVSVFLAAITYVFHSFNIIRTSDVPFNYLLVGFTIEIFVLSFALIYSFNFHKRKHLQLSESLVQQQLDFSNQLLQVQEAEKKRIAEDIHDELGGNLAAIKMNLQSLHLPNGNAEKIISLIDNASDNARSIAHNLMPPEFAKTKLQDLLQNHFNLLNTEGEILFHFFTTGANNHFNKENDLIIYRMVMELTNNITKHSKASEATVQLLYYDTCLEIMAEDNGKGFTKDNNKGIGMRNVQSRVGYLQGTMNIDTNEHGTAIIIKLPYTM